MPRSPLPLPCTATRAAGLPLTAILLAALLAVTACQYDRESRLAEIRTLQAAGKYDESIAPLRVLLTAEADQPEANYRLGVALVQTGRPSLAIWPLQKAAQSEEFKIQAGLLLASTLLATESYEEAIRASDQVLAVDPDRISALYTRARANISSGKPADALKDAEHILQLQPDDFMGTTLKVGALLDLKRYDEAEAENIKLKESTEKSGDKEKAARACAVLARFYASREKLDKAATTLHECMEKYPTDSYVQQYASDFFVETNKPDEAIAVWRKAVELAPEEILLRSKLGSLLQDSGHTDEAEAVYKQTVDLFDNAQAYQLLSSFYRKTGRIKESREAIEKAIERSPKEPPALRFALADALIAEGNYDRAEQLADSMKEPSYKALVRGSVKLAKGDPAGALKLLESGIRLWPNNPGARYVAGQAALQLGDLDRALAEYREATRVDETATDAALAMARIYYSIHKYPAALQFAERQIKSRPFQNGDAHVIAIRAAAKQGLWDKAQNLLQNLNAHPGMRNLAVVELAGVMRERDGEEAAVQAVEKSGLDLTDEANAMALTSLSLDLVALGRQKEALKHVDAALKRFPTNPKLLDIEARLLARMARDGEAKAAVEKALKADPNYAPALEVKAMYANQEGRTEEALALYDRAAAADPENADYAYQAARVSLKLGHKDDAIARLRKVVSLSPGHVAATNDLAWWLAQSGQDLDLALSLAKRAIQLDRRPETLDTLGWVQLKRNDADAAITSFQAALQAQPDSPSIRYHLGMALSQKGDSEGARENLKQALQEDFPEKQSAEELLARLEKH